MLLTNERLTGDYSDFVGSVKTDLEEGENPVLKLRSSALALFVVALALTGCQTWHPFGIGPKPIPPPAQAEVKVEATAPAVAQPTPTVPTQAQPTATPAAHRDAPEPGCPDEGQDSGLGRPDVLARPLPRRQL